MKRTDLTSQNTWKAHEQHLREAAYRLVRDSHAVDDLMQDAWLVAQRRSPQEVRDPRAWLRTVLHSLVVNRYREEQRRRDREQAVARPIECTLPESLREYDRLVMACLGQLDPKYADPLQLRYLEDESPRHIAQRLCLPVNTVRTRIERGLAKLRERVRVAQREPNRWSAWWASTWPGGLAAKVGWSGLALVGIAVFLSLIDPSPRPKSLDREPAMLATDRMRAMRGPQREVQVEVASRAVLGQERTAHLEVELVYGSGGDPLVGEWIRLDSVGAESVHKPQEGTTGADGTCSLELAPGTWRVHSRSGGARLVHLDSGDKKHMRMEIDAGLTLAGHALRSGEPMPFASIWLSLPNDLSRGEMVAVADAEGHFRIPSVDPHSWIGVSLDGVSVANLTYLDSPDLRKSGYLALELGQGAPPGVYRGSVVDVLGRPVEGARVALQRVGSVAGAREGVPVTGIHGEIQAPWVPPAMTTDEYGRFEGRAAGGSRTFVAAVRAQGFAYQEALLVEDGDQVLVLEREATLEGVVLSTDGRPLAGVDVRADCVDYRMTHRSTTDGDGVFRMDGLGGEIHLVVRSNDPAAPGGAAMTRTFCEGEQVSLQLSLEDQGTIRGFALDQGGAPLAGWAVTLVPDHQLGSILEPLAQRSQLRQARTDNRGAFAFGGCSDRNYRLGLQRPTLASSLPLVTQGGIQPDGNPVRLQLPHEQTGGIRGRLADRLGQPTAGEWLIQCLRSRCTLRVPADRTGFLLQTDLQPGPYRVFAWPAGEEAYEWRRFQLAPNQIIDLGLVQPPVDGTGLVRVRDEQGLALPIKLARLRSNLGLWGPWRRPTERGELWIDKPAGEYHLMVYVVGRGPFECALALDAYATTGLDIHWPVGSSASHEVTRANVMQGPSTSAPLR